MDFRLTGPYGLQDVDCQPDGDQTEELMSDDLTPWINSELAIIN
jgi:hypothetical protein